LTLCAPHHPFSLLLLPLFSLLFLRSFAPSLAVIVELFAALFILFMHITFVFDRLFALPIPPHLILFSSSFSLLLLSLCSLLFLLLHFAFVFFSYFCCYLLCSLLFLLLDFVVV